MYAYSPLVLMRLAAISSSDSPGWRLSTSVLTATSVIHNVAGGTHERSNHPPPPTDRVTRTSATPRRQVLTGKLLARLGNDRAMAMINASLKLCAVVR
ncbi:hypothetical protein D3C79_974650 [compost metagenome]